MTHALKKLLLAFTMVLTSAVMFQTAHAGDPNEIAVEGVTLRFFLEPDRSGTAIARECDNCDPVRLIVTPDMMIYVDGNPNNVMSWDSNLNLGPQKADILYLPGDKRLVKIFLY